jgi:hypothetical protein
LNVATYKWKVHNGKIENISFAIKFHFIRFVLRLSRLGPMHEADLTINVAFFISTAM